MTSPKSLTTLVISSCLISLPLYADKSGNLSSAEDEIIIIESDQSNAEDEIIIVDDTPSDQSEILVIEQQPINSDTILLDESAPASIADEEIVIGSETSSSTVISNEPDAKPLVIRLEDIWLESSALLQDSQSVEALNYGHAVVSATWNSDPQWEIKVSARVDGYRQTGNPDFTDTDLDYGESFIRYRGENSRVTVGAQQLIWGRIDEIPPTDRLSTVDARRFILDDLQDRRLARPMLRIEKFSGSQKFDFIYLPTFREAELADSDSIWYPIDRNGGKVLGIEVDPAIAALMPNSTIINDAPDTDHAVGLRFSSTEDDFDYALTVQHGRQTLPYFSYDPLTNTFTARYPRSWSVGGDLAFESNGTTWRFEAAALSDVPVTDNTGYNEVAAVNWAAGMEFYPGDGNTRVNLQLAGNHLVNADNTLERDNVYNFNGSIDIPFAQERWRANTRFFFGLDEKDIYINPEIAYLGWEPHEVYIAAHYFDGNEGTLGGFHEDHSIVSLGWRAKF